MQRAFSFGGRGAFDIPTDDYFLSFELGKRQKHNGDSEGERFIFSRKNENANEATFFY